MKLGNGLWEHTNFNTRLQVAQIGLGTSSTNSTVLQLAYNYGTTANNGNLLTQTITIPGLTLTQSYTYDELNRLATAKENNGASWKQKFRYDRYGNRRIDPAPADTSADLIGPNPVFAEATNRIVAQTGEQYQYDSAGNLTRDRDGQTYVFDAENKIVSFNGGASQGGADYRYDGAGQRVKKVVGTVTTIFVYDAFGQLIAEYSSAPPQANGTRYVTSDHLGSARVVTNSTGVVQARHDYHPFGEEVGLRGGRSEPNGYVADNLRQKFTQKERDVETGLDYFGARYYASTQGRFTSPDPMLSSGDIFSPQSWNRYTYVKNNPLRYIDPLGLYEWDASLGGNLSDADLKTRSKDKTNYTKQQRKEYKHMLKKRKEFRNAVAQADRAAHSRSLTAQQRADVAATVAAYGTENQHNGVTVGIGNLAAGTGAQAQLVGYVFNTAGVATLAKIQVTINEHTTGQTLAIAVAHEGYHVAANQAAVAVWTATGSYQQARSSPLNLATYDNENIAYRISAYMAMAIGRSELTYSDPSGRYQIWRRGMQNVDQQVLDRLLNAHYRVTPASRGGTILP